MSRKPREPKKYEPIGKTAVVTVRLSPLTIKAINEMSEQFTGEAQIKISKAKVIELAIFHAQKKSLRDLL